MLFNKNMKPTTLKERLGLDEDMELIEAFSKASKRKIPYKIKGRREGDVAICYADTSKANKNLKWFATKDIYDMCKDTWRWQTNSIKG